MNIAQNIFHHDNLFTIGVEEEYMLCCPHSGELINRANEIMHYLNDELKPRHSVKTKLLKLGCNKLMLLL